MQILHYFRELITNQYSKVQDSFMQKNSLKNLLSKAYQEIYQVIQQIIFTILITQVKITANENCPICLNDNLQTQGVQSEQCRHSFCIGCIFDYWRHAQKKQLKCPCCRAKITSFSKSAKLQSQSQLQSNQFIIEYRFRCTMLRQYIIYPFQIIYNTYKQIGQLFRLAKLLAGLIWQMGLMLTLTLLFLYILSPIDLLPEIYFGIFGLVDDLVCLIFIFWIILTQIIRG